MIGHQLIIVWLKRIRPQCSRLTTVSPLPPAQTYTDLVDSQPLGKRLFREFCQVMRPEFDKYNKYLDAVVSSPPR